MRISWFLELEQVENNGNDVEMCRAIVNWYRRSCTVSCHNDDVDGALVPDCPAVAAGFCS